MRIVLFAMAALAAAPTAAFAKKAPAVINPADYVVPVANPADYAVPVEAFTLGKTKVKSYDFAFSASDYVFASGSGINFVTKRQGVFKYTEEYAVTVDYSFTKLDGAPLRTGRCVGTLKIKSGAGQKAEYSPYFCRSEGDVQSGDALEAVTPSLIKTDEESLLSTQTMDPDKFKAMKATLRFNGVLYEAAPTNLTPAREEERRRVADGWLIRQGGKLVGRIDFPNYKGLIVDEDFAYTRKSIITAPVAESDGREAVIYFASQLLKLPEANAPRLF